VLSCTFDGTTLAYQAHGDELALNDARGIYEPSLCKFDGKYYLTLRNDNRGYATVSEDGLHFAPIRPWRFDDGSELGSYNTQQHWLAHGDGLFLAYTRRGANNDQIPRHRAPLFLAQVNPHDLTVIRRTEQVLIPERGVQLGNFKASAITAAESWVTDAEFLLDDQAHPRGADGSVFAARVIWSKPNKLVTNRPATLSPPSLHGGNHGRVRKVRSRRPRLQRQTSGPNLVGCQVDVRSSPRAEDSLHGRFVDASRFPNTEIKLPMDSPIEAAVGIGYGGLEIYGFHTLELIQYHVERRRGAERGVNAVRFLEGPALWQAVDDGVVSNAALDAAFAAVPKSGQPDMRQDD
jgi:hypothetical protein